MISRLRKRVVLEATQVRWVYFVGMRSRGESRVRNPFNLQISIHTGTFSDQKMGLSNLHRCNQFSTLYHVELVEMLKPSGELTLERTLERFESQKPAEFLVNLSKARRYFVIAQPALVMNIIKRPVRDVDRQLTLGEAAPISRKKRTFPIMNCRTCGNSNKALVG